MSSQKIQKLIVADLFLLFFLAYLALVQINFIMALAFITRNSWQHWRSQKRFYSLNWKACMCVAIPRKLTIICLTSRLFFATGVGTAYC